MDLILNQDYLYDSNYRFYYLTKIGAEKLTGLNFTVWTDVERRLRKQGQMLKSLMCFATYNNFNDRKSKKDYIEYKQYSDLTKREAVLLMLGELAEASYDTDLDRLVYEEQDTYTIIKLLPYTMVEIGRNSGMITRASINFEVPEDEYQVGY